MVDFAIDQLNYERIPGIGDKSVRGSIFFSFETDKGI